MLSCCHISLLAFAETRLFVLGCLGKNCLLLDSFKRYSDTFTLLTVKHKKKKKNDLNSPEFSLSLHLNEQEHFNKTSIFLILLVSVYYFQGHTTHVSDGK